MRHLVALALVGAVCFSLALLVASALAAPDLEQVPPGWRLQRRCAEYWSYQPEEQPYQQCWREWILTSAPTPSPRGRDSRP